MVNRTLALPILPRGPRTFFDQPLSKETMESEGPIIPLRLADERAKVWCLGSLYRHQSVDMVLLEMTK